MASNKSTFLPVEIEIEIFRKMNNMRDLISYALTTKHRTNILKTHAKTILDNKKLLEDDFFTWFKVLEHFDAISILYTINMGSKYWLKCLSQLILKTTNLMKKYNTYRRKKASDNQISIAKEFLNKYPNEKRIRDDIAIIINTLIKPPIKALRDAIQQSNTPIFMHLRELPFDACEALSLQYHNLYAMYFLNVPYNIMMKVYNNAREGKSVGMNFFNEYIRVNMSRQYVYHMECQGIYNAILPMRPLIMLIPE